MTQQTLDELVRLFEERSYVLAARNTKGGWYFITLNLEHAVFHWEAEANMAAHITLRQATALSSMVDREEFDEVAIIGHIDGKWTAKVIESE